MDIAPLLIVYLLALLFIIGGLMWTIGLHLFLGWWRNHTG